jgi:hypothetical protein
VTEAQKPPVWAWIIGGVIVLALVLGLLRILDWIFSLPVLIIAVVAAAIYLWYRNHQKSSV